MHGGHLDREQDHAGRGGDVLEEEGGVEVQVAQLREEPGEVEREALGAVRAARVAGGVVVEDGLGEVVAHAARVLAHAQVRHARHGVAREDVAVAVRVRPVEGHVARAGVLREQLEERLVGKRVLIVGWHLLDEHLQVLARRDVLRDLCVVGSVLEARTGTRPVRKDDVQLGVREEAGSSRAGATVTFLGFHVESKATPDEAPIFREVLWGADRHSTQRGSLHGRVEGVRDLGDGMVEVPSESPVAVDDGEPGFADDVVDYFGRQHSKTKRSKVLLHPALLSTFVANASWNGGDLAV